MADRLFSYKGLTAAVTGGSRGLGKAIADELTARGASSVIIPRGKAWTPASFDLVFLNAAYGYVQGASSPLSSDAGDVFQVNVLERIRRAQEALHGKTLHVHLVGSVLSHISAPNLALYAATKHALRGWVYGAARELPGRVSISYPNGMRTGFFSSLRGDPQIIAKYSQDVEKAQSAYDPPEKVAEGILDGITYGAREIIPTAYSLDWFVKNEVDIRRMWHPGLDVPSGSSFDWWKDVQKYFSSKTA